MPERSWRPGGPLNLGLTLAPHRHGSGDPVWQTTPDGALWRACRTPEGPGTLRLSVVAGEVHGMAWGLGAEWLLETMPDLLGAGDPAEEFGALLDAMGDDPVAGFLKGLHVRASGLRIGRAGRVFEALVPAVLEQKVVGREAFRAWRWLVRKYGDPAPGPGPEGLRVPPAPGTWRLVPSWDWHRAGAEAVRARTIINAARHEEKLETAGTTWEADRLLRAPARHRRLDLRRDPPAGPGRRRRPQRGRLPHPRPGRLRLHRREDRRRGHAPPARTLRRSPPPRGPPDRDERPPPPAGARAWPPRLSGVLINVMCWV